MQAEFSTAYRQLNCSPNARQAEQFQQYVDLLQRWNKVHNLTAIRHARDIWPTHIFDSLSVAAYMQGQRCLDVGSGAGLPGIPLAIMQPEREFVLLDSALKRTRFMQQACLELELENVSVVHARVEQWQTADYFDVIISRAFASVNDFVRVAGKHLRQSGVFYAMKGKVQKNNRLDPDLGYQLEKIQTLHVPFLAAERHLLIIRKRT